MNGNKPVAIGLTRREAIHLGLGTLISSAVAATGTRAEDGKAAAETTEQERLAISFWNFGLLSTGPDSLFHALEMRMAETVERGFNCIRTECGTGITHDAEGRPRGELECYPVLPGHDHFTRELQHVRGGSPSALGGAIRRLLGSGRTCGPHLARTRILGRRGAHEFRTDRPGLARVPRAAAACERRVPGREAVTSTEISGEQPLPHPKRAAKENRPENTKKPTCFKDL